MSAKIACNKLSHERIRAFSVHVLTASGSLLALLGVVAAAQYRFVDMFWWLGLALIVDGFDGPIARRMRVKEILPDWSGDKLDNIIDYLTYVVLPAFALYQSNVLGSILSSLAAGMIVISSAIYYARAHMKTEDHFFCGFPAVWNMVVFFIFALNPSVFVSATIIFTSVILTFVPIKFLHPTRVVQLRPLNISVCCCWFSLGFYYLISNFQVSPWVNNVFSLCGIYLYSIGAILQYFSKPNKEQKNH
ncbi:MAG: phosphatidylcholine/phosphatidylserine synthase [Candidatus Liberibacter ctenarytainae]|uniref:Phosphatidylcholine synthase n=1 Tax=Candidatus Liberibacter ctenarytainae TaxID=2020335 RepID=A0A937DLZ2_9HYPH|nr:phosphatidylcholine/phosphatidylserine synthase [Candidatus Liberibacter ctenarytainae]